MKQPILLHINVPFVSRCPSFIKDTLIEGHDSKLLRSYVIAMANELKANAEEFADCTVTAVRVDGGSATITDGSDLEHLFRFLRSSYDLAPDCPISIRTCPADINGANMPFYNRIGFSRYDLELYSLEPQDFIHLGTLNYTEQMPYITHGFLHADRRKNMGFILLYGKKDVSKYGFRHSVLEATRRPVSHVLLQRCQGPDCMEEEAIAEQLAMAAGKLSAAGFTEYLPGAWAKPGCEDPYLQGAAKGEPILGIGLGAETRMDGAVSRNTMDLLRYLRGSGDYTAITESVETTGPAPTEELPSEG